MQPTPPAPKISILVIGYWSDLRILDVFAILKMLSYRMMLVAANDVLESLCLCVHVCNLPAIVRSTYYLLHSERSCRQSGHVNKSVEYEFSLIRR
jgi:hypothetical protein